MAAQGSIIWPNLQIDAITLGLLVVSILPWFTSLIESASFPGGWEIKFRDLAEAAKKVVDAAPATTTTTTANPSVVTATPAYLEIASKDPNLGLAGLRIEIEQRLRAISDRYGIPSRSNRQMLEELRRRQVFDPQTSDSIQQLITAGNQAVHGAKVEPAVAEWAINEGPGVLAALDRYLLP